jgi:hypothetical protein
MDLVDGDIPENAISRLATRMEVVTTSTHYNAAITIEGRIGSQVNGDAFLNGNIILVEIHHGDKRTLHLITIKKILHTLHQLHDICASS